MGVKISKVGRGFSKMYVDSRCLITVIYKQGEVIGRLNQTFQNASKGINIMCITMGDMGQYLRNLEIYMEYYASKLHQVEKQVEVSNLYDLSLTSIMCYSLKA